MSFFRLFSKKEALPDFVKQEDVKLKRINLNYIPPDELLPMLRADIEKVSELTPVNYYAIKARYIEAFVYYLPDYSGSMIKFVFCINERIEKTSEFFVLSFSALSSLFSKIGKYIKKQG